MRSARISSDKLTVAALFAFAFAYQLFSAVKGFDMTDEGYLMSLYQSFGEDVSHCPSAAGYPLTCYLGWWVQSLWPYGGILWVRFVGIIIVTATMAIAYLLIRRYTDSKLALLGLALQILFLATDPKPFGYNNLTAFIYICATVLLVLGSIKEKPVLSAISGLLAGFGVFLRLPDLAFAGLCILPFFTFGINRKGFVHCIAYLLSFAIGICAGWMVMRALGTDSLILGFFASLGGTLEGESTHSSSSMLGTYAGNYLGCLKMLFFMTGAIVALALCIKRIKLLWPLILVTVYIMYRQFYMDSGILNDSTMMLYNAAGILGCSLAFSQGDKNNIIPAAAILFSILAPLGSDRGFTTMWVGTWISLPIGLVFIARKVREKGRHYSIAALVCLVMVCVTAFLSSMRRPYYDGGSRLSKKSAIESPYARGIKTKESVASITNEVLATLKEIGVRERDTILVFDSSPMLYYLTGTKSFDEIIWPCIQYGDQYVRSFNKICSERPRPKAIVIQKFSNLGNGSGWDEPGKEYTDIEVDGQMSTKNMRKAVFGYIQDAGYTKYWHNDHYDIYTLPDEI